MAKRAWHPFDEHQKALPGDRATVHPQRDNPPCEDHGQSDGPQAEHFAIRPSWDALHRSPGCTLPQRGDDSRRAGSLRSCPQPPGHPSPTGEKPLTPIASRVCAPELLHVAEVCGPSHPHVIWPSGWCGLCIIQKPFGHTPEKARRTSHSPLARKTAV